MAKGIEKETKRPKKKISKKANAKEEKEVIVAPEKIENDAIVERKENKKEKKKNYNHKEAIIIMILSMIIGAGVGSIITRHICNKKNVLKEFNEVYSEIKDNYYKSVSKNSMLYSSLSGLVSGLNDRYTYVDDDKNAISEYEKATEGKFEGIGINIYLNENNQIFISSTIKDSPAEKNGIQSGDVILKMDGIEYSSENYNDFSNTISAYGKGRKIELELLRNDEIITKEFELDEVNIESVYYYKQEFNGKSIGLFVINNFADNTYDQFYNYYKEAKDEIEGIILDVRCNQDGKVEVASKIASLFLEKDSVIFNYNNKGEYEEVINKNKREITMPVVVVVNEGTMNSGELLASALKENLNIPVVGTKTYGKGLIQNMIPLANGRMILYSTKEWVTSKKQRVEEVGITPTDEIKCEQEICEIDVVINKALEIIAN